MHIPDGYLSPSTCAALYALSSAGWYAALRRVRRMLSTRAIPLISVFAAFSFVVMMFNVPLPGGTTGHALGVTVAAIVLGPWGSILAISIALAIQALFFGDGGITTLGANCFNMAIVGSFVAYFTYRVISGSAELGSRRRVIAAAIAGYLSINVAALVTAIEFGIQPMFFHDAAGAPLYAPYSLHIAIPAMMIGHLTLAGVAEAAISAGMISYLQRADLGLLQGGARYNPAQPLVAPVNQKSVRRVWAAVALLMLLTPLGILAVGTAWGEWAPSELAGQAVQASANHQALPEVPAGLEKLAGMWTAPFPGYAPSFIKSSSFGYLLSGMFAVGIFASASSLYGAIRKRRRESRA